MSEKESNTGENFGVNMIEEIADKLMQEVVLNGRMEKSKLLDALKSAEREGFNIGFDEGYAEAESRLK